MLNLIAQTIGYAAIACFFLGLVLIALSDRKPMDMDGSGKALPEAAPQQGEPPHLPPAIIFHLAIGDREAGRAKHDKDFAEARARWAAKMEIERMIYEIEEGA